MVGRLRFCENETLVVEAPDSRSAVQVFEEQLRQRPDSGSEDVVVDLVIATGDSPPRIERTQLSNAGQPGA